ncbi:hypothetical protein E0Z10_g5030 [Xylaria hypoxylon]|uniref:Uncharacterized protein n=1 Tax=Xylaria hypoxylon TaxID=37992 RepID=A0A4Z0YHC7_9PEZI|nr:hypothetical protein E0Z10_g5030 [Xylaria hypoxylon]
MIKKALPSILRTRFVHVVNNGTNTSGQSDEIYPVHFIDQAAVVRSSLISYTFRYDHVLDAQKLRESLAMLLASGNWRKLGGRLRKNRDGKLEIHVPLHFNYDCPPFRFSHVKFDMDMNTHPLASLLPKKTGSQPSVHEGCHKFREFSIPSTLPTDITHYLSTDEPLICLHINSFNDGTLVSLTFPHSLSDAMGTVGLLKAWAHVLHHHKGGSPKRELWGAREDVSASVGAANDQTAQNTKFVLEDRQTTGLPLLFFMARYAVDALINRNIETHHIYLPASFLSHLRQQAEKETRLAKGDEDQSAKFVSDGDLITAWGSRMVISSARRKGMVAICNVFDMRGRLDSLKSPGAAVYLQNLILPSTTLLTTEEANSLSVSGIAFRVRRAIIEQTSDAQVRSLMRLARIWFASLGTMPLFVSWNTVRVIACTNWSKARFLDHADFGPAAVKPPGKTGVTIAKPVAYWGTTLSVTDKPRDTFVIYGKDHEGGYWVHAYLRKETWQFIRAELDQFRPN